MNQWSGEEKNKPIRPHQAPKSARQANNKSNSTFFVKKLNGIVGGGAWLVDWIGLLVMGGSSRTATSQERRRAAKPNNSIHSFNSIFSQENKRIVLSLSSLFLLCGLWAGGQPMLRKERREQKRRERFDLIN